MNQRMNTEEQQLFVNSFKLYLDYGRNDTAFVVDLDNVWEWMGYTRTNDAKRALTKYFKKDDDYVENLLRSSAQQDLSTNNQVQLAPPICGASLQHHGGHNKMKTMMTVKTFKKLCMKAGTEKADKVRDYYLKMAEILQDYTEECLNDSKHKINLLTATMTKVNHDAAWARHHALIAGNEHKKLVYILLILNLRDNTFVIKVGSTDDIRGRVVRINSAMGLKVQVLEVFLCNKHREFEDKIKQTYDKDRYTELINNRVYSTETFLMKDKKSLESMKLYIRKELHKFYHLSAEEHIRLIEELHARNESVRLECVIRLCHDFKDNPDGLLEALRTVPPRNTLYDEQTEDTTQHTNIVHDQTNEDNVEEQHEIKVHERIPQPEQVPPEVPTTTEPLQRLSSKAVGPKVQLYDPTDITKVVKVIDGLFQATVEVVSASFSAIKLAAKNKTIYKGYRWFLINRDDPEPHAAKNIGATKECQIKITGSMIAMLNIDTNLVENVFNNQVEASAHISQSTACICLALKSGSTTAGYHWKHWNSLTEEVQNEYLDRKSLPEPIANIKGHKVQRIDIITGDVLEEYMTQVDVYKKLGITPKSIKKASATKSPYNGFLWNIC